VRKQVFGGGLADVCRPSRPTAGRSGSDPTSLGSVWVHRDQTRPNLKLLQTGLCRTLDVGYTLGVSLGEDGVEFLEEGTVLALWVEGEALWYTSRIQNA